MSRLPIKILERTSEHIDVAEPYSDDEYANTVYAIDDGGIPFREWDWDGGYERLMFCYHESRDYLLVTDANDRPNLHDEDLPAFYASSWSKLRVNGAAVDPQPDGEKVKFLTRLMKEEGAPDLYHLSDEAWMQFKLRFA